LIQPGIVLGPAKKVSSIDSIRCSIYKTFFGAFIKVAT
jgi:hypothetical protein